MSQASRKTTQKVLNFTTWTAGAAGMSFAVRLFDQSTSPVWITAAAGLWLFEEAFKPGE
jgi:hypothetical protein